MVQKIINKLLTPFKTKKEKSDKEKFIKHQFISFFDEMVYLHFFNEEQSNKFFTTYEMGVCLLDYNEKENTLIVYLRKPSSIIETINVLEKHLNCKILLREVQLV